MSLLAKKEGTKYHGRGREVKNEIPGPAGRIGKGEAPPVRFRKASSGVRWEEKRAACV